MPRPPARLRRGDPPPPRAARARPEPPRVRAGRPPPRTRARVRPAVPPPPRVVAPRPPRGRALRLHPLLPRALPLRRREHRAGPADPIGMHERRRGRMLEHDAGASALAERLLSMTER